MQKTSWGAKRKLPVEMYETPQELGQVLAADLLARIAVARAQNRRFVLGCPGGRSLQSTYVALGELAGKQGADLSQLIIVMMDDYLVPGPDGTLVHCPADAHYSCRRFASREILDVLNAHLPPRRRIAESGVWFPHPDDPPQYDRKIEQAGGIDVFLTASGASDGHVAFNPPGSAYESRTRIIPIAESTRRDNLGTFPQFKSLDEVPRHGISVGISTIAGLSKQVVLVICGPYKRQAVQELAKLDDFSSDWPVSLIFRSRNPRVLLDRAAAGM